MFSKTHQRRNIIICLSLGCSIAALSRIRPLSDYFKALLSCFFPSQVFSCFNVAGTGRVLDFLLFYFCFARFSSLDEENTQFCCENIAAHLEHTLEWEREMVIKRQQEVRSVLLHVHVYYPA